MRPEQRSASAHPPGELLDDRYRLGEVIGRGGHGVVYKAIDVVAARPVAVKFLHPELADDPELNVRMLREAQATAKLAGTAAIQVHALRTDHLGALFIVMELLDGADLEEHLAGWEDRGELFPLANLPTIFDPIVRTLSAAHARGIVHRDLKPGNIFVVSPAAGGGVKLLDFGLAKVMAASPLTRDGMVAGSPSYIAPEVWRGDPRKLDHRIDIYSLGALLYRVLAGRPPFSGTLIELMQASLGAARPTPRTLRPELPEAIDDWVNVALAIAPGDRFLNVDAMWVALRGILGV